MTTRASIEEEILAAALGASAPLQVIEGPRGSGRSSLLRSLQRRLRAAGARAALVEMDRVCVGAASVARHLPALVARAFAPDDGTPLPGAWPARGTLDAIETEGARRKPDPVLLLDLALSYPQAAAAETGARLILLLDELGEAACLARHAGLKGWPEMLARRLAGSPDVVVVATVCPSSRPASLIERLGSRAAAAGRGMMRIALGALDAGEVAALLERWGCPPSTHGADLGLWMKATHGHPAYVEILARRVARGGDLAAALHAELSPPHGLLHQECRFDYHHLVERSRGHAAVRSILQLLCSEEGANLSRVARHLGTSLPTAIDYLSWLLEVGLVVREGRGYLFADPLLRLWLGLNGPEPVDTETMVRRFLETAGAPAAQTAVRRSPMPRPLPEPESEPLAAAADLSRRDPSDRLMEID